MCGDMCSLTDARAMVTNDRSVTAIDRLEKLFSVLTAYGVADYVSFDLGMLSKYNYYTGVIFKAYTYGVGDAVVKGGRYDKLLTQFGREAGAVGFCALTDNLLEALSRQKVELPTPKAPEVLYYTKETFLESLAKAQEIRKNGRPVVLTAATGGNR